MLNLTHHSGESIEELASEGHPRVLEIILRARDEGERKASASSLSAAHGGGGGGGDGDDATGMGAGEARQRARTMSDAALVCCCSSVVADAYGSAFVSFCVLA